MNTNEKYMTDEQFNAVKSTRYVFTIYANRRDADLDKNAHNVLCWCNNDLTRHQGQLILEGIAAGATTKYKHPCAVIYAVTGFEEPRRLSLCCA